MANEKKSPTTHRVYGGAAGDAGSTEVYGFSLRNATDTERAAIAATVTQLVAEHASASKIVYTTLTGRAVDGRPFAEATLLPIGDTIRVTLGAADAPDARELRRLATYMLSAYLSMVHSLPLDELDRMCQLADEAAENGE